MSSGFITFEGLRQKRNKDLAEAWIAKAVEGDAALGRSGSNFSMPPEKAIKNSIKDLNKRGIRAYSGSGNYFQVDITGDRPRIIQRRPLAKRYLELIEGGLS